MRVIPHIGCLILAAGASRRFAGQAKQLLKIDGQSLIRRIADTALAAQLNGPVMVVLGANREQIAPELAGLPVHHLTIDNWEEGMSAALRAGLTALSHTADSDAVVVLLCDQPLITPALIRQLATVHVETGKALVACRYNDGAGVPALFARSVFPDLLALTGDKGARYLLKQRKNDLAEVDFEPATVDLDSWQDVEKWASVLTKMER